MIFHSYVCLPEGILFFAGRCSRLLWVTLGYSGGVAWPKSFTKSQVLMAVGLLPSKTYWCLVGNEWVAGGMG